MMEFPFGAAFFMPTKDIGHDLAKMREANMNVARLEWIKNGVWEAVELAPGVYDFDAMDEAMDAGAASGVKIILQIGIHPPRWVRDTYGGVGVVNDRGLMPYPKEKYSVCYDNPKIRQMAEKFIRTMVRRYKDHPALYGWVSWNEPHLSNEDITCYCPHTIELFKSWLKEKYGDLETLNSEWNEGYPEYTSWDQVEPPRQRPGGRGIYKAWQDWRTFMDKNFSNLIKWVTKIIREEDSCHPTKVNLLIPVENTTVTCSDVWSMADTADEIGVSLFVEMNEGDFPQLISQSADLIRSASSYHNNRFWLDEIMGGPNFVNHGRPFLAPDKLISLYPWLTIGHGAKGFTYWMWRPLHRGLEAAEFGLVGKDGSIRPRTIEAAKTSSVIQKHADLLLNVNPKNEVCIMHSPAIYHLCYGEGLDTHTGSIPLETQPEKSRYTSALMGAYTLLWEENYGVDFISPEHMNNGNLKKYKVLVLPFPYLLEEETAKAIKEFVEEGGLVVSEFPNIMKYEDGRIYDISPGGQLNYVFGFEEYDIGHVSENTITLKDGFEITIGDIRQVPQVYKSSAVLGHFSDGEPAAIFNRYGRGGVLSFCAEVFRNIMWSDHKGLANLIKLLFTAYGVNPAGELNGVDADLAKKVQIVKLVGDDGEIRIILNHNQQRVSGILRIDGCEKWVNLMTDEEMHFTRQGLPITLDEYGVLALHCQN